MFQKQFYKPLVFVFWFCFPTFVPAILWNENLIHSFLICVCFRYIVVLHSTWLVNSAAHLYGTRPYDTKIEPRENPLVIYASFGEGYHNYHHTFPWDYSTSEFNWIANFNFTTLMIDLFALIGQVDERKTASEDIIQMRINRTGEIDLDRSRFSTVNQVLGCLLGTSSIWIPCLIKITANMIYSRPLLL